MRHHSSPARQGHLQVLRRVPPITIAMAPLVALVLCDLGARASAHCIVWAAPLAWSLARVSRRLSCWLVMIDLHILDELVLQGVQVFGLPRA